MGCNAKTMGKCMIHLFFSGSERGGYQMFTGLSAGVLVAVERNNGV